MTSTPRTCETCTTELPAQATGRPRRFCTECTRARHAAQVAEHKARRRRSPEAIQAEHVTELKHQLTPTPEETALPPFKELTQDQQSAMIAARPGGPDRAPQAAAAAPYGRHRDGSPVTVPELVATWAKLGWGVPTAHDLAEIAAATRGELVPA